VAGIAAASRAQARQILAKMLRDKLMFRPERRGGQSGYRFTGEGSLTKLLTGLVPGFSQAVASPSGTERLWYWPVRNRIELAA
jgi:hypothetical protein